MKKAFLAAASMLLFILFGGALLTQCSLLGCNGKTKTFTIQRMEWQLRTHRLQEIDPSAYYDADSVRIYTRLAAFEYTAMRPMLQLFPAALACKPGEPRSLKRVSSLEISLLDSLQLANGTWLAPGADLDAHFKVLATYQAVAFSLKDYWEEKPYLYSTLMPLNMAWNTPLADSSYFRVAIKLSFDDQSFFQTPALQPIELRIY